jgi:NADH-quinone oxidoreductase subunit M
MLKLGGYGVIKFMLPFFSKEIHLFFRPAAILICLVVVIYGGFAALRQVDLKRQIAFSSISHMSFATLGIFTFTEIGIKGSIYLMLSHGLTSAGLFFLVGILSDRYHTRSVMAYSGLFAVMPLFAYFLLVFSLANVWFPGTSGFLPEFLILTAIIKMTPLIFLPTIFGMFLTTASILIMLLRLLYGHVKVMYSKSNFIDATRIESFILFNLTVWIFFLGLYDIFTEKEHMYLYMY